MSIHSKWERWNGRQALRIGNGLLETVLLPGGGHLAELRMVSAGGPGANCLWAPQWPTADPGDPKLTSLTDRYGGDSAARFLAGFTGHALCLDLFGPPSEAEAALGTPLHGEAAVLPWSLVPTPTGCVGQVALPAAQLACERRVSLASAAPILFIEEQVENRGNHVRELHWVQHLTLGPPFLAAGESEVSASLDRGRTWPLGYEGHAMLRDNETFAWPDAPALDGGVTDLREPFARSGKGFVAAVRVSCSREIGFITALNFRLGMALVYCFRRRDFPWVAIWEENCARTGAPWSGKAQARGMEFGTTPMPVGREALQRLGTLFDTPSTRTLAPGETHLARYLTALCSVPVEWHAITDVQVEPAGLRLFNSADSSTVIMADGLSDFFQGGTEA